MTSALSFSGVVLRRQSRSILSELDLEVPVGSLFALLGASGAGKTTALLVAMGMIRAEAGTIECLGCTMSRHAPRAMRSVAYVPDRSTLAPFLSVADAMHIKAGLHADWDAALARDLLRRFGVRPHARMGELSKGEATAVSLMLAVAQRPRLLILDEPTDGLDPVLRREAIATIVTYAGEASATVVMATHQLGEVERLCDTIAVLEQGRVIGGGPLYTFRDGFRILRVEGPMPSAFGDAPFTLLSRQRLSPNIEDWVVRDWSGSSSGWFESLGIQLQAVHPVDLEEGVVELLRLSRRGIS